MLSPRFAGRLWVWVRRPHEGRPQLPCWWYLAPSAQNRLYEHERAVSLRGLACAVGLFGSFWFEWLHRPFQHGEEITDAEALPPGGSEVQGECLHGRRQGGDSKKFKGVRYRHDRHRWVAEMKPPKSKNKVFFEQFQSETDAARVVDVALHHYGKPLNFADTPQILATERSSQGLGDDEKLKLVKEQAKWVASMTATLPSSPALSRGTSCTVPSHRRVEILEPSSLGLRSFSEISSWLSCGDTADEADDGVSQPHHLPDLMAGCAGKEAMKVSLDTAHQACVMDDFGETLVVENAIADPCDVGISLEYFVNVSAV